MTLLRLIYCIKTCISDYVNASLLLTFCVNQQFFLGLLPIQYVDATSLEFFLGLLEFCFMPSRIRKTAFVACQITPKRFDNLKLSDGGQVMKFGYIHNEQIPLVLID